MATSEIIRKRIKDSRKEFGPYTLLRVISQGATGIVVEAEHRTMGRRVALKTFSPNGFENSGMNVSQLTDIFLHEARVLCRIDHPNVVPIYDAGFARGGAMDVDVPYMALRLVEGGDLQGRIKSKGPMNTESAVRLALEMASGLQAIHEAGYMHLDMKPANILMEASGLARISDFTLARPKGLPGPPGPIAGTPGYLAPEQLSGATLDERTDLYSAGATLFFALTGAPAFETSDLVAYAQAMQDALPSPCKRRPEVHPRLAAVAMHAMHPDPKCRYQNARELIYDCRCLMNDEDPELAMPARKRRSGLFDMLSSGKKKAVDRSDLG